MIIIKNWEQTKDCVPNNKLTKWIWNTNIKNPNYKEKKIWK